MSRRIAGPHHEINRITKILLYPFERSVDEGKRAVAIGSSRSQKPCISFTSVTVVTRVGIGKSLVMGIRVYIYRGACQQNGKPLDPDETRITCYVEETAMQPRCVRILQNIIFSAILGTRLKWMLYLPGNSRYPTGKQQ
ncbi:hypothetical protein CISG_07382 [Coccidioides immitis RMSCC 3703]|uniref:Uncharacterized protein n=1 Tax=Coccidioides immitis RMSCC 3703 TaxID=454286 RepID=A0A0J8R3B8_COCIT|nr:hypothetical protein CISG_07382 [Coccidioides immitis RMSCC 3703]